MQLLGTWSKFHSIIINLYRLLVDVKWMKQWKKYVGYDQWDQSCAGQEAAHPGPVYNAALLRG
jgi:hypothetical protein